MRLDQTMSALQLARKFIDIADKALPFLSNDMQITGSKETSAARRASLDLTRALAEMRKP